MNEKIFRWSVVVLLIVVIIEIHALRTGNISVLGSVNVDNTLDVNVVGAVGIQNAYSPLEVQIVRQ